MTERVRVLPCFGGEVTLRASGRDAEIALIAAESVLRRLHGELTTFEADSALSRLNDDPRPVVESTLYVLRLAAAVEPAGRLSGGLVDATIGSPGVYDAWRTVGVNLRRTAVVRPAGVRIDSGGLAKGMAADLVAHRLGARASFAVECLGDLRVGGQAGRSRPVQVTDPFGGTEPVAILGLRSGAVATSGTTRRAGHLIDPRTGESADTGIVQATAIAPTGLEAEVRAKGALLAGPRGAARHLPDGGVLVLGSGAVVDVPRDTRAGRLAAA